jgi:hypothetical protein
MSIDNPARRIHFAVAIALILAAPTALAQQVPIDLNTWSKQGPPGNGTWTVAANGESVLQTINGDPTFFVSPVDDFEGTITGTLSVETTADDDYIGFVFGYGSPLVENQDDVNDFDFILLDWKQFTQPFGGFTAEEGFSLVRVDGTITDYIPGFWGHTDHDGFQVLATDFGPGRGWADLTVYTFTMSYFSTRITVTVDGGVFEQEEIFDLAPADVGLAAFPSGRFGFYNYSQQQVRYAGFTAATSTETSPTRTPFTLASPYPNPATVGEPVRISFNLRSPAPVRVAVHDLLGREVAVLSEGVRPAGPNELSWAPRGSDRPLAPGIYIIRVEAEGTARAARLALIR